MPQEFFLAFTNASIVHLDLTNGEWTGEIHFESGPKAVTFSTDFSNDSIVTNHTFRCWVLPGITPVPAITGWFSLLLVCALIWTARRAQKRAAVSETV